MAGIPYEQIHFEFVTGGASLRELSKRHGVKLLTLQQRSTREGWSDQREANLREEAEQSILTHRAMIAHTRASKAVAVLNAAFDTTIAVLARIKRDAESTGELAERSFVRSEVVPALLELISRVGGLDVGLPAVAAKGSNAGESAEPAWHDIARAASHEARRIESGAAIETTAVVEEGGDGAGA